MLCLGHLPLQTHMFLKGHSAEVLLQGLPCFRRESLIKAILGKPSGGYVSKGGLLFVLLKEFITSKDISPFSPFSPWPPHFPFPFFFLVMTRGHRNTTHIRVLVGQSGGGSSFMNSYCWLLVVVGLVKPPDQRLDRSDERNKREWENERRGGNVHPLSFVSNP